MRDNAYIGGGRGAAVIPFPSLSNIEPWVTKPQLARHLGLSTRWIELRHNDGLPVHKRGRAVRYRIGEVEQWLADRFGGAR